MSQYPSPYQAYAGYTQGYDPHQTYHAYQTYLSRFARAGGMLIVLGAILLIGGISCAGFGLAAPWEKLLSELATRQPLQPEWTPEMMRLVAIIVGSGISVVGLVQLILGIFVRKAGIASTIIAIVIVSLAIVLLLLMGIGVAVGSTQQKSPPAEIILGVCMIALPLAIAFLQLVWLASAAKGYSRLKAAKAQYYAQYWQYVQAQQGYMQAPYPNAYGVPQPPTGQGPVGGYGGTAGAPIPPPPPSQGQSGDSELRP